jgi:hypothetical protein
MISVVSVRLKQLKGLRIQSKASTSSSSEPDIMAPLPENSSEKNISPHLMPFSVKSKWPMIRTIKQNQKEKEPNSGLFL